MQGKPSRLLEDRKPCAHGALRIVFVCFIRTKDGEQTVARILEDAATLRLDDWCEVLQRAVHDGVDVFGVKRLAQRRGPNHVREQNRHHFELLLRCPQCGESGSQRGQGDVHDSVTEDVA